MKYARVLLIFCLLPLWPAWANEVDSRKKDPVIKRQIAAIQSYNPHDPFYAAAILKYTKAFEKHLSSHPLQQGPNTK